VPTRHRWCLWRRRWCCRWIPPRRYELTSLNLPLPYIANICLKCFKDMFLLFYLDVANVDRDVTHVAMVIHVCCMCMFQMFKLFADVCCKSRSECCNGMFQTYTAYVAMVRLMLQRR
jgi:hypothetical protein